MRTALALIAFALPLLGCLPQERALPNPAIPHRVAERACLKIWVRRPDDSLVQETVRVEPGWYIASPQVVDPKP